MSRYCEPFCAYSLYSAFSKQKKPYKMSKLPFFKEQVYFLVVVLVSKEVTKMKLNIMKNVVNSMLTLLTALLVQIAQGALTKSGC